MLIYVGAVHWLFPSPTRGPRSTEDKERGKTDSQNVRFVNSSLLRHAAYTNICPERGSPDPLLNREGRRVHKQCRGNSIFISVTAVLTPTRPSIGDLRIQGCAIQGII